MKVSLSYWTPRPVSEPVRHRLLGAATKLATARVWLFEPIQFFELPEYRDKIFGDTLLFREESSEGDGALGPRDELFMAYLDIQAIVAILVEVSKSDGVGWRLRFPDPIGAIENGVIDKRLSEFLETLSLEAGVSGDAFENEVRRERLLSRIAGESATGPALPG